MKGLFTVHEDNHIPPSPCTHCGKLLDGATGVSEGRDHEPVLLPKPGDVTVCIVCGHLMAFGDDLRLRDLTKEEMVEVAGHPSVLAIQRGRAAAGIKD